MLSNQKMNISKWLSLCVSITIINQAAIVDADYLVSIRIHNYSNPTNQCATCPAENNHCCDIQRASGVCDECNILFRYCVRKFGDGEECRDSHQSVDPGRTALDFSREFLLLRPNPLVFRGAKAWMGAHINLTVYDRDLDEPQNDILSEVQVNLTVNNIQLGVETAPKTYTGPMGYSNITLSFYVTCAENWYGPYCNIFSQDYMCDLPVPCQDNCVGVVCGENRHCVDGVDQYVCTCDQGFTGRQCDINIDECEGVNCSGNGRCVDGVGFFQCECDSGYSGVVCEIASEGLSRFSTANTFLNTNALYILIPGAIGWGLVIFLLMVGLMTLICTRLRKRENTKNSYTNASQLEINHVQQQNQSTALGPPIIMRRNQAFSVGGSISNNQVHKNISYRFIAPEQLMEGPTMGRVHDDDEYTLTSNQAYERNGESHYEDIV